MSDIVELGRQFILEGRYNDLKKLLVQRRLLVSSDMCGVLPIHLSAGVSKNASQITAFLLKMGSSANARTKSGKLTPLHISIYRKNYEVAKLLLQAGGNPLLKDEDNRDCFSLARRMKDKCFLKILKNFDMSSEMTDLSDTVDDAEQSDDDCQSLVDQFETTLGNTFDNRRKSLNLSSSSSSSSADSFVTAIGSEVAASANNNNVYNFSVEDFIVKYPLEMQLAFGGKFTNQELQKLDAEFTAAFRLHNNNNNNANSQQRMPLGRMRHPSGRVFFNYFLFDPRQFPQLRAPLMGYDAERISLLSFLQALFYVGKGVKNRPTHHLEDAKAQLSLHQQATASKQTTTSPSMNSLSHSKAYYKATSPLSIASQANINCRTATLPGWTGRSNNNNNNNNNKSNAKIDRVLSVWAAGRGVVALHVFNNQSESEAFTREACCIDALSLANLTNKRRGDLTGPVSTTWPDWKRRKYGAWLILRAWNILRMESPPELLPNDFK